MAGAVTIPESATSSAGARRAGVAKERAPRVVAARVKVRKETNISRRSSGTMMKIGLWNTVS
jgi:hypothetical protein